MYYWNWLFLTGNRRTKISHDPNNTNWSRSTTSFGHRILTSQGWSPGDYLGARNAAHADTFTSASASHIRVTLKDDNLGLGARPGGKSTEGEPTGLDAFQGLLGRLNGKSDTELEKDQRKRDDIKLAIYAGNKWKTVNFVRAGLLEQEKPRSIEELETRRSLDQMPSGEDSKEKPKKRSKKDKTKDKATRDKKRSSTSPGSDVDASTTTGSGARKSKTSRSTSEIDSITPSAEEDSKKRKSKSKSKKRKTRESSMEKLPTANISRSEVLTPSDNSVLADSGNDSSVKPSAPSDKPKEQRPAARRFIRGRNIMQKKMALMDDRSLNEVIIQHKSLVMFSYIYRSLTLPDIYGKIIASVPTPLRGTETLWLLSIESYCFARRFIRFIIFIAQNNHARTFGWIFALHAQGAPPTI